MLLLLLLFSCSVNAALPTYERIVKTNQGLVRGFREHHKNHYSFFSIPYATTPMKEHRFKAPLPPPRWQNVFNATTRNIVCPQRPRRNENVVYQEDCLRLNVFVPYNGDNKKQPVCVHIHGGAFIGSGDRGGPENIVKHGVIVVTFEYRVGVLGFLCLGTAEAPGNAGIKDQVAALHWVRQNIANFGGDPDNITVYGTSAGAVALDTIILSDRANGLFKRAISESGSAFVGVYDVDGKTQAYDLAKKMGFQGKVDSRELLNFFQKLSPNVLGLAPIDDYNLNGRLGPCIETIESDSSIITKHPIEIIKKNNYRKIPYIMGYSNLEGLTRAPYFSEIRKLVNQNVSKVVSRTSQKKDTRAWKKLQDKIKKAYFGTHDIRIDDNFIKFCSDIYGVYPALVSAMYNAKNSNEPVYLFEFSYDGGLSLPRDNFNYLVGARHGDFWAYVFTHGVSSNRTADGLTVDRVTTLLTNFVKFGNPTPSKTKLLPLKWSPVTKRSAGYLSIGNALELKSNLLTDKLKLIDQVVGFQIGAAAAPAPSRINTYLIITFLVCLWGLLMY